MTYYKLFYSAFILCFFLVTIAVCENRFIEGTDMHLCDICGESCLLYGPDGEIYTQYEPSTKYSDHCGYLVRDIDISQNGLWSIIYKGKEIQFDIHVVESPAIVTVNGARLSTIEKQLKTNTTNKIYFATYHYYEGDKVDVVCMSIAANNIVKKHYVVLKYSYAETLHNVFKNNTFLSFTGAGFRTTLQAAHNNSFMSCKFAHSESYLTTYKIVRVTFLLQNALNAKPIAANTNGSTNIVKVQFRSKFGSIWKETIPLQLNLPENKALINMYTLGSKQIIYYEYENDEHLFVNCSTSSETMQKYYLKFDWKASSFTPFVTLDKQLSSADNNTTIQCFLLQTNKDTYKSNIIREISLVLRMSTPTKVTKVMAEDDEKKDFHRWILYLVVGVVICFLMCCSMIIYTMKKKNCYRQRKTTNCSTKDDRRSTLKKDNSSNYEFHYSVPNNQRVNPSYYENININSDSETNLTYAVLDLSTPAEASNKLNTERATYAEINHKV